MHNKRVDVVRMSIVSAANLNFMKMVFVVAYFLLDELWMELCSRIYKGVLYKVGGGFSIRQFNQESSSGVPFNEQVR